MQLANAHDLTIASCRCSRLECSCEGATNWASTPYARVAAWTANRLSDRSGQSRCYKAFAARIPSLHMIVEECAIDGISPEECRRRQAHASDDAILTAVHIYRVATCNGFSVPSLDERALQEWAHLHTTGVFEGTAHLVYAAEYEPVDWFEELSFRTVSQSGRHRGSRD